MMTAFLSGLTLGLSLILAIGAQNALVLRQGLKREHVFAVSLTCALSDALLIIAGVSGFSLLQNQWPGIEMLLRIGGGLFLLAYGLHSLWAAWRGGDTLEAMEGNPTSMSAMIGMTLALTWLNPHVYLDTLVLLGSVSTHYDDQRWWFAAGAMVASVVFFFSLGYGARVLLPLFRRPVTWRWLDLLIGLLMLWLAWGLLADQLL